jgi:hypothetical protein
MQHLEDNKYIKYGIKNNDFLIACKQNQHIFLFVWQIKGNYLYTLHEASGSLELVKCSNSNKTWD